MIHGLPRRIAAGLVAAAVCAGVASAAPEGRFPAYARLRAEADAAAKAGALDLAERRLSEALALFPHNPGALVRLSRVQARRGETEAASRTLLRYASEGLQLDLGADPVLSKLATGPEFAPAAARLAANRRPIGRLERSRDVAVARPLEGAAFDPVTGRLLFSAVGGHVVLAEDGQGWRRLGEVQAGALFGMAVDAKGRRLWVAQATGAAIPGARGPQATGVLCLDLDSGRLISHVALDEPGDHQLGDVALGLDGAVYASDSVGGGLYRLRPGADRFEVLVRSDELGSPQGMVVADRGRALIVADYPTGLHRVELATGAMTLLAEPADVTLAGMDGLAADGLDLIATQNGIAPQRVLRIRLGKGARRIRSVEVLLANPQLAGGAADLSLGAVARQGGRKTYVFVARSGWEAVDDKGDMPGADPQAAATLGWLSLEP